MRKRPETWRFRMEMRASNPHIPCMMNAQEWVTERRLRRSFGRWQPHGPGNSLRKRITVPAAWLYRRVPANRNYELFADDARGAA